MRGFLAVMVILMTVISAKAYDTKQTVVAAQEALARLGYDVGKPDGAWGGKSRGAMNEVRAANGLPEADEFSGSSMALLHRLSPGETTLPKPGFFFTDVKARRDFLKDKANSRLTLAQCPSNVGNGIVPNRVDPVEKVTTEAGSGGFITQDADWFSPVMEGLIAAQDNCLKGKDNSCQAIVDFASKWADADALKPGVKRDTKRWEDISWIGNIMLRSTILAYGVARQFVYVPADREAVVLDWLKRRVDDYHYLIRAQKETLGNHALAHMTPAMAFGILVGDRTMMEPALETWRLTLDKMRKDGSLPAETRRGARWSHYSNIQIGQLITVAELAAGEGIDLYATAPEGKTVQHAVSWLIDALADFDVAKPYSKENMGSPSDDYTIPFFKEFHFGWLPAYIERFGDDENIERMKVSTVDPRICSSGSLKERKIDTIGCMSAKADTPLSLAKTLQLVGISPLSHMGYPAGCLQASKAWVLADE
jgi:poly(beta-D-mannuronate) lyase